MDKYHLDAIVAPTGGPAWLTDLVNGDHVAGGSSNAAAVAGYPNINVTAGFHLRPAGGYFFLRARLERTYSNSAGVCLRTKPKWRDRPPRFLSTVGAG
jgi:amidase